MSKVTIVKKEYKGWKNCIEISNGIIDIIATTDVGPRIIRFGFVGKENEFHEAEGQIGQTGGDKWNIFGGHRLWHAPEDLIRSRELDNSPIEWEEIENGVILSQPVEPNTHIKKEIEITMSPDEAKVYALHRITNKGLWPVELAAWSLSVMAAGGKHILPQVKKDTGLLPNRMIALWPYTKLNDNRVYWGENYITLQQDPNAKTAFKIGLPNEDGWAAYVNHNHLFIMQHEHFEDAIYPDYGSSYETYTASAFLEIESLSPLELLEPGDAIEHTEVWSLYDNAKVPQNEEEIEKYILPYVK